MDSNDRGEREEMLRRAVLGGDERAWKTWYDESYEALHAFVLWRTGGARDRADEIVQETWLTAVRKIRSFDPRKGSFAAWLRGLAVNALRHHLRRERRMHLREQAAHSNGSTEANWENGERNERVVAALDALSEGHEDVLRAKYLDGLTVVEIAAARNETPKAVESLLTRAREAFRKLYEKM
jgi:RNA polymerase sigma-70 factor, ECF subfamily